MDQVIFGGLLSEPPQVTDSFTGVIYIFDESRELDSQGGFPDKIALKLWNGVDTKKMFLASASFSILGCIELLTHFSRSDFDNLAKIKKPVDQMINWV